VILNAQQKMAVSGQVTDKAGLPLIGVAVIEHGMTSNGVITDTLGRYTIKVPPEAILEFSSIGFKGAMEHVNGRKNIDVVLSDDNELLEATVVIGYGTSKKGDLTGTVSVVNMDEIRTAPVISISQALQGKIAGAEFSSGSGEVGEPGDIRIRGSRSITAGNQPLIVVDGVVDAVSDLNEINPSDIVSISVLKDVSSTAIYGSRGANGVIVVTTSAKPKKDTKLQVTVKSSTGFQQIAALTP
jgi:TonB-dependent SusC/RagA subfamily outer membrane receptor